MIMISDYDEVYACNNCRNKSRCKYADVAYNSIVDFNKTYEGSGLSLHVECDNYEEKD